MKRFRPSRSDAFLRDDSARLANSRQFPAFSLIELLVVLAIIALLAALAAPGINSMLRGSHLSSASQVVVDQLNSARQAALSRQLPVEVRFYKLPAYDAPAGASPTIYRAMQSFMLDDTNSIPLTRVQYFPAPVVVSTIASQSSLFDDAILPEKAGDIDAPPFKKTDYSYRSFYFKPSGAINLPNTNLFLTLIFQNAASSLGSDYATIQLNPITGRPQVYRP